MSNEISPARADSIAKIREEQRVQENLLKLRQLRERKDLALKPLIHLKKTYTDFSGDEKPLVVRYYQIQGIIHLLVMNRFVLGDDTGLGKTLEVIIALCYILEQDPKKKILILAPVTAAGQWATEIPKFTTGIKTFLCLGTPKKRDKIRSEFEAYDKPAVFISSYRSVVQDFKKIQNWNSYRIVFDECTVFKNPKTVVYQVCHYLTTQASSAWGLTATLIKNQLLEGYGIYQVIRPGLFNMTKNQFMLYYCMTKMIRIKKGMIPIVVGYRKEQIEEFKAKIEPFFLGRSKHEVAEDLPALISKKIEIEITAEQEEKYKDSLTGLLEMVTAKEGEIFKETSPLTAIAYCQEIVNHLGLIGLEGKSPKVDYLLDLLTEGEFADENVIIYTRFSKMVDILMKELAKKKIKAVRVTGKENSAKREKAKEAFQNPKKPERVMCITAAGLEALNLQSAKALICFDTPWSAGDFLQLLGRMIRIGSIHDFCYVLHLVARRKGAGSGGRTGKGGKTVDHRVLEVLDKKMELVEAVLGEKIKKAGPGREGDFLEQGKSEYAEILAELKKDANRSN